MRRIACALNSSRKSRPSRRRFFGSPRSRRGAPPAQRTDGVDRASIEPLGLLCDGRHGVTVTRQRRSDNRAPRERMAQVRPAKRRPARGPRRAFSSALGCQRREGLRCAIRSRRMNVGASALTKSGALRTWSRDEAVCEVRGHAWHKPATFSRYKSETLR